MIYTLTMNPAVDMNVTSDGLEPNKVIRTRGAVYTPNGKGLNVSFTLRHFGVESQILGFFGGFTGDYIIDGARRVCPVRPVCIDGITRLNLFLTAGENLEYKLPNEGAPVSRRKQIELLDLIRSLDDLECLVVSGSLPPQIEPTYYQEVIDVVKAGGGEFVLDISHPCLARLIEEEPLLIKPNGEEAAAIFGVELNDEPSVLRALHMIHDRGAKNILLTLGADGAYFFDGICTWHANAAQVKMLSSACAGDATLASFLSLWYFDHNAVEFALKRAMATGGSVAMSAGLGDFSQVGELERSILVTRIE